MNLDPVNSRPDICHQVLMTCIDNKQSLLALLDSPLNKSGHMQVFILIHSSIEQVYVHTKKNVLIEINPNIRIPRTYKRFAGLMSMNRCFV